MCLFCYNLIGFTMSVAESDKIKVEISLIQDDASQQ